MDSTTLQEFKEKFLEIQQTLMAGERFADEALVEALKGDDVDLSHEESSRQLRLKLEGRNIFYLKKIQSSLGRIEEGCYGTCEECGEDISLKRLMARPTASLCINCKEEQERGEEHILYDKKSHTLGKSLATDVAKPAFGEWSGGGQVLKMARL